MMQAHPNVLGKDVNVHRRNAVDVRGYCINQLESGITVKPRESHNVWIPWTEITEIFWEDFKPIPAGTFPELDATEGEK